MLLTNDFPICEDYIRQINNGFVENGWLALYKGGVGVEWHMDDGRFAQGFSMLQATASHLGPRREIRLMGSPQVERKNVTDFCIITISKALYS